VLEARAGLRFSCDWSSSGPPTFSADVRHTEHLTISMRCFYHEDKDSVGSCKSCGKGLCRECAVDLTKGLACCGRCEADAQALIQLIDRNIQLSATSTNIIKSSLGVRSSTAIFQFVTGAVFIAWGLTDLEGLKFLLVLGAGFIAYGGYWLVLAQRLRKDKAP